MLVNLPRWRKSQSYRDLILSHTPVSYWRLGEVSDIVAVDEMAAHNGTYLPNSAGVWTGGTLGQTGAISGDSSKAALFNGTNGLVDTGFKYDDLPLSVECWARVGTGFPISSRTASSVQGYEILFANGGVAGNVVARWGTATANYSSPSKNGMNDGLFHHFVLTLGSGVGIFYVDGAQVGASTTFAGTITSTQNFYIGRRGNTSFFNDRADEVAVYNRVLTSAEILAHYNKGIGN